MGGRGSVVPQRIWVGDEVAVITGRYEGSKGVVIERDGNNRQVLIKRVRIEFTERNENMVKDQKRKVWLSVRQLEITKHSTSKLKWDRHCAKKARRSACKDDQ